MKKTIYTLRLKNEKNFRYDLIRFCEKYNISTYLTWQTEGVFEDDLFVDVVVEDAAKEMFEAKYKTSITKTEPF